MSAPYQMNPYAPAGLAVPPPASFQDLPGNYVFEIVLTANEEKSGASVSIQTDSDFFARGIVLTKNTGTFKFQYADESGYFTSNALIDSAALPTTASNPFPITPQLRYSAGGRITINITDTSGAGNTIQMLFVGSRRFLAAR